MQVPTKNTGDQFFASEANQYTDEIENAIQDSNQVLSAGVLDQLSKALSIHSGGADFYTDSGVADAYVASTVLGFQGPTAYFNGLRIRFVPVNTNTGASTVNVNSLGIQNIKLVDGTTDPPAGLIESGQSVTLYYNGTDFVFISESAEVIQNLSKFSGLPITAIDRTIPGPTINLDVFESGDERRVRVNQTLAGGATNQVIATFNQVGGSIPFYVVGTVAAYEFLATNVDMGTWDFQLVVRLGPGGSANHNLDVNNRALINNNFSMFTRISFNTNSVDDNNLELRVSYSGGDDISNFSTDMKIIAVATAT